MRRIYWNSLTWTGALLALAGMATPVRAQDPDDLKRGVARISVMNGDVNVRRGDSGDWVAGVINAPLMTDDRVATGAASRAEVEFDAANVIRLGANAELHLAQLEYGRYQIELGRGIATFRMLRQNDVNVEIDTPSVSVRPSRQGSFRILVNDAGETEVTARLGEVEVFTPRGSQWVRSGQTLVARGAANDPEFQVEAAGGLDDWDRWCESRDRMLLQSTSSRYVGQGVYGAEDLDNYGSWETVPEYGPVWRPTVAADWTPYYYGRWTWADWYGWTWVSYDPWGWAPYHYGRWFHHDRFGWCWYPGSMRARHYWSPALVGFIGHGGGGYGVGFGYGNIGWVALAPYEVYHPWWGRNYYRSGGYVNHQVNIVNVNVTNTYRNARYNGITSVGANDFSAGRFNHVTRMNGSQITTAGAIHGATPFTPGSQNLRFSDRNAGNVPQSNQQSARMFRSQTPTPAQRVPFQQLSRGGGSVSGQGASSTSASPQTGGSSWRRFGQTSGGASAGTGAGAASGPAEQRGGSGGGGQGGAAQAPRTQQVAPRSGGSSAPSQGGWQRFGSPGNGGSTPQQAAPSAPRGGNGSGGSGRTLGSAGGNGYGGAVAGRQEFANPSRGYSGGGQESLRVAPPVVRQRQSYSAPSYSAPSYSAPRQSAPSYSAPRQSSPSYSAPRSSGGGGGGGGHASGGGGGGHRGR